MRNIVFLITVFVGILTSCDGEKSFSINGSVQGSDSMVVYLDRNGISGLVAEDSAKVSKTGKFNLKGKRPQGVEYYCLRIGGKRFHFVADEHFSWLTLDVDSACGVKIKRGDSVNVAMAEAQALVQSTNQAIRAEVDSFVARGGSRDSLDERVYGICQQYKDSARRIIISDTKSPVAYYLAFQKLVYGTPVFRLDDKKDLRYISAIATAWQTHHRDELRTKHLLNLVGDAYKSNRQADIDMLFEGDKSNFIDLSLRDARNKEVKLSSLSSKYVLLDFCSYSQMEKKDVDFLRNLYRHNKDLGLEFYQVSYDRDSSFWKKTVEDLPWVCVRDENMISSMTYNVTSIPSNYLLDKDRNLVAKNIAYENISDFIRSRR